MSRWTFDEVGWRLRGQVYARNPLLWPYPSDSFWNTPIGDSASLVPLGMAAVGVDGDQYIFRWEEDIIVGLGGELDSPEQTVLAHDAGWSGADRCASRTGLDLDGSGAYGDVDVPYSGTWDTTDYLGTTPNHSGACLRRRGGDVVLMETQPLHICSDGEIVSQYISQYWVGDSIMTGGDGTIGGSHGGGFISAFGGTIRMHEWRPGGVIPHATKIVMDTSRVCYNYDVKDDCFTWPALAADSHAATTYGTNTGGRPIPPEARMGMLLTLPASFDTEALATEPARILARSIKKYGTYLCDGDNSLDVVMFSVEWSKNGRFIDQFYSDFGIRGFHKQSEHGVPPQEQVDFWADMNSVYTSFMVVADNSPLTPGGAGATRRAPAAPPLGAMP